MKSYQKEGVFKETKKFQDAYNSLLSICEKKGSLVFKDRLLEKDQDIFPYHFVRKGTMEYIFPKQETFLVSDKSVVIDTTEEYKLWTEAQSFSVDASKVNGRIKIEYVDSGDAPELKVIDMLGESRIPKSVRKTLEEIFA